MRKAVTTEYFNSSSLIDFLEDFANDHKWDYERFSLDEIILECPGSWGDYKLSFMWIEDMQTLGISASFQMDFAENLSSSIYELLARVNEQLWIGHFDLSDEGRPTYRYTLLVGKANKESGNQIGKSSG